MWKSLIEKAIEAQKNSYSPYSKFKVGASILCSDGEIITGCNVENASYGLTICAERVALTKAVSQGKKKFKAIAIVLPVDDWGTPCGACRQFIREFGKDIIVIMAKPNLEYKETTIEKLLPYSFGPENL